MAKKHFAKPMMSEKNIKKVLGIKPKAPINRRLLHVIRKAVWFDSFDIIKGENRYCLLFCSPDANRYGYTECIDDHRLRGDCIIVRNKLIDIFQRHHNLVKKDLADDWSRHVKKRDGNMCAICGETDRLSAHHWCRGDKRSKMATWEYDNGITLCYYCHMQCAHDLPDWLHYNSYAKYVMKVTNQGTEMMDRILKLSQTEVCDKVVRRLWFDRGLHDPRGIYAKWENEER